jgi:hypothetical protein
MIPVMPVQWMPKSEADARGLTQVEIREALIQDAKDSYSHPHPEGLAPSGQPEVVYRTIIVNSQWGDSEAVEGYCIWIEKDEDGTTETDG